MGKKAVEKLASRILREHRPIPISDGDVLVHSPHCRAEEREAAKESPTSTNNLEEWAVYWGKPCQDPGYPDPFCSKCLDGNELNYVAWPCDAARLGQFVLGR